MSMRIRKILSIAGIILIVLSLFAGCSNDNASSDDYSFWKEPNQVRLTLPIQIDELEDSQEGITELGDENLPTKYQERIKTLKEAMISYFEEVYNIDISSKLEAQKIKLFTATDENEGVMGYVNPEEPEYLNLNKSLLSEYLRWFDASYVHESLHQLGFRSKRVNLIDEGITDALTDLILTHAKIESYVEENSYAVARTIGYQIVSADKDIAKYYLENENPNILARINEKMEGVNQPFEKSSNLGRRLNTLVSGLMYGSYGTIDPYYVAFETQEIATSYCKTFSPDKETIDYIRSIYLVAEYEEIEVNEVIGGYEFMF